MSHTLSPRCLILTLSLIAAGVFISDAKEEIIKDSEDMKCYIYSPDAIKPGKTYQLVVGVHGAHGHGKNAAGLASWAEKLDCIVIGPSFQDGYQGSPPKDVRKLKKLTKTMHSKFKLEKKIFLFGHSGGAQFAHRFTFNEPNMVLCCVATSAGSWATGGKFGSINTRAKNIPFYIGCGDKDTELSVKGYPYNRINWFKKFATELKKKKFKVTAKVFKGKKHGLGKEGKKFATEAYQAHVTDSKKS